MRSGCSHAVGQLPRSRKRWSAVRNDGKRWAELLLIDDPHTYRVILVIQGSDGWKINQITPE